MTERRIQRQDGGFVLERWQRQQVGALALQRLGHGERRLARNAPLVRDRFAPALELRVEIVEIAERTPGGATRE